MASDIRVLLRGGEYNLPSTITFDRLDSGTNGYNVIYAAYPGERPMLHGGQHVTRVEPAGGGIYKAGRRTAVSTVYVNGGRAIRARTPNAGSTTRCVSGIRSRRMQVADGEMGNWQRLNQVEMIILGQG